MSYDSSTGAMARTSPAIIIAAMINEARPRLDPNWHLGNESQAGSEIGAEAIINWNKLSVGKQNAIF